MTQVFSPGADSWLRLFALLDAARVLGVVLVAAHRLVLHAPSVGGAAGPPFAGAALLWVFVLFALGLNDWLSR